MKQILFLNILLLSAAVVAQSGQNASSDINNPHRAKPKKTPEIPELPLTDEDLMAMPRHPYGFFIEAGQSCGNKPVRRACGIILDHSGRAVPDAMVTLWKDKIAIKSISTGETGKFDFDAQPGSYRLFVTASDQRGNLRSIQQDWILITVSKPKKSCNKPVRIVVESSGLHCDGYVGEPKIAVSPGR